MNGNEIVSSLDKLFGWITRAVVLNLLWIFYTLKGLLIGGMFPATAAALGVTRKWVMGDVDISIRKTFKDKYKQEFVNANIMGWVLTFIGGILYFNYQLLLNTKEEVWIFVPFSFYILVFFFAIIVIWSFPLLSHFHNNWFEYMKIAFIIGLTKIHYTLAIGLSIFASVYLSLSFPGVIPFFSFSVPSLISIWLALQVFKKMLDEPFHEETEQVN
ncbi:YesL family protein [Bacillus mesophilum]|uniref:YesL family protein n=1 Tax=Bacillus mesophilum TaxID=1071718 RepID=A0A7V7RQE5_9BACI|nr:YesL family protein [Bacillus mesophilum]KAB2335645.1 YesL family protein [Bacillus mesophilum]